jgi:hypothetical protein
MKDLRPAFFAASIAGPLAALLGVCPALASPAGDIAGTWECRQPGVQYRNKPPIFYAADAGSDQVTIEVDGFSREIYGRSEVLADQDGWFKVKPAQGQEFMIRPERAAVQKTASMGLRFGDAKNDYRCLRLPPPAPHFAPAERRGTAAEGAPLWPPSRAPFPLSASRPPRNRQCQAAGRSKRLLMSPAFQCHPAGQSPVDIADYVAKSR